jgi:hypothetical protein
MAIVGSDEEIAFSRGAVLTDAGLGSGPPWHNAASRGRSALYPYSIFRTRLSDQLAELPAFRYSLASEQPMLEAFLLTRGAPDPGAPPYMRQRFFAADCRRSAGLAGADPGTQRQLESIGPVLRG